MFVVSDLYGLLLFLGVDPYWVYMWWTKLVFQPYCHGIPNAMHDLLTSVLWRTVKDDVLDQVCTHSCCIVRLVIILTKS